MGRRPSYIQAGCFYVFQCGVCGIDTKHKTTRELDVYKRLHQMKCTKITSTYNAKIKQHFDYVIEKTIQNNKKVKENQLYINTID